MLKKYLTAFVFTFGLVGVIMLWLGGLNASTWISPGHITITVGRLVGLVGFYLALWQLLLIGRVVWIERTFGHDVLSRWHHYNGVLTIGLIGLHPILLILGQAWLAQKSYFDQILTFGDLYPGMLKATLAYCAFLGIAALSVAVIRKRLKYEWWYNVHFLLYLAIVLSISHQFESGLDLATDSQRLFWRFLLAFVFLNLIWYRFWRPVSRSWQQKYKVGNVQKLPGGYVNIEITGKNLAKLPARAGQFVLVRFLAAPWWSQSHPFSFSRMPDGHSFRLTVKDLGDFTSGIGDLPVNTPVLIDGPHGRLTLDLAKQPKVLLLAGGIGIAPLRALFEDCVLRKIDVELVYSAVDAESLVLRDELQSMSGPGAKVSFVVGRIDAALVNSISSLKQSSVFICGPNSMMIAMQEILGQAGVKKSDIFLEKFDLG